MPKKHRDLWPMPVQEVITNPLCLAMNSACFAPFMRICLHYWATGCLPLPESSAELQCISRAIAPTWLKHREAILKAFQEIQPSLDSYRKKRLSNELFLDFSRSRIKRGPKIKNVAPTPTAAGPIPRSLPKAPASTAKAPAATKGKMKDRIPLAA